MENGYELQVDQRSRLINRSDQYADTLLDIIVAGCDWHLQADAMEYKTGPTNALGQIATLGQLGVIGRLGSDIAQSLVLTATAGTPAAATPGTLTATKAVLAENFNSRLIFSSELRKVPLRWTLLPYDSSGIKFWTST